MSRSPLGTLFRSTFLVALAALMLCTGCFWGGSSPFGQDRVDAVDARHELQARHGYWLHRWAARSARFEKRSPVVVRTPSRSQAMTS